MRQSEGSESQQMLFVDRFVQWPSPRDDLTQNPYFAEVPNIGELKALTHLYLNNTGITGTLDFGHHPMMTADFCCAFHRHQRH
jgi:hypothetical protein